MVDDSRRSFSIFETHFLSGLLTVKVIKDFVYRRREAQDLQCVFKCKAYIKQRFCKRI